MLNYTPLDKRKKKKIKAGIGTVPGIAVQFVRLARAEPAACRSTIDARNQFNYQEKIKEICFPSKI
jgi:hypothetical protein